MALADLRSLIDLRSLVVLAPSPPRWPTSLRAAAVIALPLVVSMATGHGTTGFLTSLGSFSVLYGAGATVRRRARVIAAVGAGLVLCAAVGALTAGNDWLTLVALVLLGGAAAFTTYALRIGPPGVFFFILSAGVANAAAAGGTSPWLILGLAVTGAVVALVVGTSDVWFGRAGPEAAAVDQAEEQVERFGRADPGDRDALDRRRAEASRALHAAWTSVTDAGPGRRPVARLEDRLHLVHARYVTTTARITGSVTGVDLQPWDEPTEQVDPTPVERAGDLGRSTDEQRQVERTQLRYATLGRPSAAYSLRQAAWWPSESILVAARVVGATLIAGGIATAISNQHVYWAVAFAALIVQAGGSRRVQATKAMHRVLGTFAGLGVFALVLRLDLEGWWLVLFVTVLQAAVELVVTRHYALAVALITPLALTISAAVTGMATETVVEDRLLDTVLGVGAAVLVLLLTGLGRHEVVLRAHARRVALAVDAVLKDLVDGAPDPDDGVRRRQHLYVELLESDSIARRALADAPAQVAPFRDMERVLSHVGYLVLGAAWHEHAWGRRERFVRAREALSHVIGRKVTERRSAEELTDELRAVERALTAS